MGPYRQSAGVARAVEAHESALAAQAFRDDVRGWVIQGMLVFVIGLMAWVCEGAG